MEAEKLALVRRCIYCGTEVKKEHRGEHIVPAAIGGDCTLKEVANKSVCARCNNGTLSRLDQELCNRSHLSVIASQEIAANLWQVWEIDHKASNLLVEAKPQWEDGELRRLICHPQMIFEKAGPQIRGDAEEMKRFGKERVLHVMVRAVKRALARYERDRKRGLHFERVRTDLSCRDFRLPPRVYAPRSLREIEANHEQSFVLRYLSAQDRRFALNEITKLEVGSQEKFKRSAAFIGSNAPPISIYFDLNLVVRAMMKIALNLLAAYCSKTEVNCDTFSDAVRAILGKRHLTLKEQAGNGFVHAEDLASLAQPNCHSFRITRLENAWAVYMSYFGGRIGCATSFTGPDEEDWKTLDVVAPIDSKNWTVTRRQLILPIDVRVEWQKHEVIVPSLKLQYSHVRLAIDDPPGESK